MRIGRTTAVKTGILAHLVLLPLVGARGQDTTSLAQRLDSIAGAGVAQNRTVGTVVAVASGSDTLLLRAYGKADLEWDVPMTTDAMFEVGSLAKQFAAASILQLRDAGKLTLDDRITRWFPELDVQGRIITLRHLLSHTSGIHGFGEDTEWEMKMFLPNYPRDSAYQLIKLDPFLFPAGSAQAYSNSGFWLIGAIVERASGMKYEDYLATKIFQPIGMTRSMFCNSSSMVLHRAHGYQMAGGAVRRAPMINYGWVSAPGALCSTATDLVTWLTALHGGKVLSAASYAEMITPARLHDGTALQYGMGLKVGTDVRGVRYIGHGGTAPGFRADATWYPDAKLAVVVLMNASPAQISPSGVGNALAGAVLGSAGKELAYFTGDAAPFVGRYEYVVGGNQRGPVIEVSASPRGLAFSVNGSRPEPLPWAGGVTFYGQETVTLTFVRANGGSGPVLELHRDDPGNHLVYRKQ